MDWDDGALEKWGRVLWRERAVTITRVREPFAIIARDLPGEVADRLRDNQVTTVEDDRADDLITLDRDVANNTKPAWSVVECVDPEDSGISVCTVQYLWFMTVS